MSARHLTLRTANKTINQKQFYETFTDRNLGILTPEQQKIISGTRVAQAGLGGNSDVLLTMAQLGFQHFTIADPDTYELSNLNRQMGAGVSLIGRKKASLIRDLLSEINPWTEVKVFPEGVTNENIDSFLDNAQVLIEAIDVQSALIKNILIDSALAKRIPVFTSPSPGWGAVLLFFDPEASPSMTELIGPPPSERFTGYTHDDLGFRWGLYFARMQYMFQLPENGIPEGVPPEFYASRTSIPCISPACRLRAALIPSSVLKLLFHNDKLLHAPSVVRYDLFSNTVLVVNRTLQEYKCGLERAEQVFIEKCKPLFYDPKWQKPVQQGPKLEAHANRSTRV